MKGFEVVKLINESEKQLKKEKMGISANGFRERIIVVTFITMQKQSEQFFFDATIEQASELIWKQFPTAVIIYADEYVISSHKNKSVTKKKLTDVELQKFYKDGN